MLIKKIASITQKPIEMIQNEFELLGYPIRSEFYFINDSEQLEQLRKKWGITGEEIPVLVSMGKNGVGLLEEIFDELQGLSDHRLPIMIKDTSQLEKYPVECPSPILHRTNLSMECAKSLSLSLL